MDLPFNYSRVPYLKQFILSEFTVWLDIYVSYIKYVNVYLQCIGNQHIVNITKKYVDVEIDRLMIKKTYRSHRDKQSSGQSTH